MKEVALFLVAVAAWAGVINKYRNYFFTVLFARIVLFSTLFATLKELAGLNLSDSGTWIFLAMNAMVLTYTFLTWGKKMKR